MDKSEFLVKKMDCPSEESMIRMKLDGIEEIKGLEFDIPNRKLTVYHEGNLNKIVLSIDALNFNSSLYKTEKVGDGLLSRVSDKGQSSLLWKVLMINFSFFIIEITTGFLSRSMGLVADSLDMLADALVYGLSLLAVGGTITKKKKIATLSGYFQIALALFGIIEVVRRFLGYEELPDFKTMIIVSIFALIANGLCLYLLQRSKSDEAHMKASMIFTSNDVIINLGVIMAGVLVYLSNSKYPDLIIGSVVFIIVLRGSFSILKLAK
ncbi:MAG: cation transporter [Sporocytophaga sp.]|uniref:cation transporter n=1 Tax=Sporocytophaga sp. TaxID=2231183 RepID=UPI001B149B96|nr:cation diffusion facilitator family transporter [Sporocytophaga sp.]MBO9699553.1 cation transporter [Sporocytophaga sp.]